MLRLQVAAEPDTPRPPGDAAVPATRTAARPSVPRARPALSAREAQALRETLLIRQALAARPDLTPEQLTALRAAASTATRTGSSGQPARRTSAGRPGTPRAPARKPVPRTRSARPPQKSPEKGPEKGRPRVGWWTRLGVIAMSTVLLPAVASLALPGAPDSGKNAPLDVTTLALTARSSLLEKADEYRALEQEVAQRSTDLQQARDAAQAARDQVAAEQEIVGTTAASLYRAGAGQRLPLLGLSVHDGAMTSDVLFRQALADRADRALEATLVRAERRGTVLQRATERLAAAQAAVETTSRRAAGVLDTVRAQVDDLSPEVSATLAGLSTIPAAGAQQDRNQRAMLRWQDYLGRLAAAGIEAPPAAELADSAHLPAGMSPALDAEGRPIPGVVWAVIGSEPVTVLPAETVAAVSNALSQLGKPVVPGTVGPETYDCGGFTSASWLVAGYALPGA